MASFSVWRAEFMMRVAGFVSQEHPSAVKRSIARLLRWVGRHRQRSGALDFLEDETSIDHMDFEALDDEGDEASQHENR